MIKKNTDIERIIKKKQKVGNNNFVIYKEINGTNDFKFAISIGKKYGNAVMRNKMKRRVREIIRNNFKNFQNYNLIIVIKKDSNNLDFYEIEKEINYLLEKIKKRDES